MGSSHRISTGDERGVYCPVYCKGIGNKWVDGQTSSIVNKHVNMDGWCLVSGEERSNSLRKDHREAESVQLGNEQMDTIRRTVGLLGV